MADVEVTCEQCGAPVILSEYAAMETICCRGCGAALRARASSPSDSVRDRLKLKKKEPLPSAIPPPPPATDKKGKKAKKGKPQAENASSENPEESEEESWRFTRYIEDSRENIKVDTRQTGVLWAWLIFVAIGSALGAVRFLDVLPESYLDMMITYGPYVALGMHIVIVLAAFKDTVFQGILCLLVPGYSVFYIFLVSDNFWLRAVCGGLLVGIGLDSAVFYRDVGTNVYRAVSDYIASGG